MVQSGVNHPIKLRFCNLVKKALIAGWDGLVDEQVMAVGMDCLCRSCGSWYWNWLGDYICEMSRPLLHTEHVWYVHTYDSLLDPL